MTYALLERAMARAAPAGVTVPDAVTGVIAAWATMLSALTPVIGEAGTQALFIRTSELTYREHTWICRPSAQESMPSMIDALAASLRSRTVDEICSTSHAMLTTFTGLLASLIGPALTRRLLRTAWPEIGLDVCEGEKPT